MFKGAVTFVAEIKGNGLKFESFEFNSNEAGVEKVEVVGQNGDEIRTTVYLNSVASHDEGRALAAKVTKKALDRMSIRHNLAIEKTRMTEDQFSPLNSKPGVLEVAVGSFVCCAELTGKLVLGIPPAELKAELEKPSLPGEDNFGLFRSALQSTSPVEAFMGLYQILLMLYDEQTKVDEFIRRKDPTVPQTCIPHKKAMETVYTRLRNELGHKRTDVNLDKTKAEMASRLGSLMALTAQAIQLGNSR